MIGCRGEDIVVGHPINLGATHHIILLSYHKPIDILIQMNRSKCINPFSVVNNIKTVDFKPIPDYCYDIIFFAKDLHIKFIINGITVFQNYKIFNSKWLEYCEDQAFVGKRNSILRLNLEELQSSSYLYHPEFDLVRNCKWSRSTAMITLQGSCSSKGAIFENDHSVMYLRIPDGCGSGNGKLNFQNMCWE